jgi:PTH2 family peptidyl-tRNA hydrolase
VVLRAASDEQLRQIAEQGRAASLPVELVHDAGRTQLAPGIATCCALGPAEVSRIDAVTGGLPLL